MGFLEQVRTSFLTVDELGGMASTYPVQTEKCVTELVFNPERMEDLRIGAKCLDEVIKNQVQAIEDAERAKRQSIANEKAAKTKVRRVGSWTPLWENLYFAFLGYERSPR